MTPGSILRYPHYFASADVEIAFGRIREWNEANRFGPVGAVESVRRRTSTSVPSDGAMYP